MQVSLESLISYFRSNFNCFYTCENDSEKEVKEYKIFLFNYYKSTSSFV